MKIGQAIKLMFHDHAQYGGNDSGPIVCKVFGELVKETDLSYEVNSWSNAAEPLDGNNVTFSILKSTVIDARPLFEARGKKK